MKGHAHAMIERFFERFSQVEQSFLRARFILLTQIEPESVGRDLDDPALEQQLSEAITALEREVERLNHGGPRRSNSITVKPVRKP